jgi:hypothetical protein
MALSLGAHGAYMGRPGCTWADRAGHGATGLIPLRPYNGMEELQIRKTCE